MGLAERLFGTREPDATNAWVRDLALRLVFDFDSSGLCGVSLGAPIDQLACLGRPDRVRRSQSRYDRAWHIMYFEDGVELWGAESTGLSRVRLVWDDWNDRRFKAYRGTCKYRGRSLELNADCTRDQIVGRLGTPYWQESEEADEPAMYYEVGTVEWVFVSLDVPRLAYLVVQTPPSLADEDVRKWYGISRPWPPESGD